MDADRLVSLNSTVMSLLKEKTMREVIEKLKERVVRHDEPFKGEAIDPALFKLSLPAGIHSSWVFVLKPETPSIAHFHPNSIQHTVMVEGSATAKIADEMKALVPFEPLAEAWCIIGENVDHEFYPGREPVVFLSFHTSTAGELVEIESESGGRRAYI